MWFQKLFKRRRRGDGDFDNGRRVGRPAFRVEVERDVRFGGGLRDERGEGGGFILRFRAEGIGFFGREDRASLFPILQGVAVGHQIGEARVNLRVEA